MRTTDAPETNTPEMQDRAEAAERARLSAEAQRVMEESRPTPSEADVAAIKTGKMGIDDKHDPENPEMPPLHEQHARIAAARGGPRRRRSSDAADDAALYHTREARAATREPAKAELEKK